MDEKRLKWRLRMGIAVCSAAGIVILIAGFFILHMMNSSLGTLIQNQTKNESEEYRKRFIRQVDKDFQTLDSLAAFCTYEDEEDSESFSQRLYEANTENDFVSMAYFGPDGKGVMVHLSAGIKHDVDYHTLGEDAQAGIEAAFKGKNHVSSLFHSILSDNNIFSYSVPVYDEEGAVKGVLTATNNLEIFEDVLKGDRVLNGNGAIYLVNSSGTVLISSTEKGKVKEEDNLFQDKEYSFGEDAERVYDLMNEEAEIFTYMDYQTRNYPVYLSPVGMNQWYIMCINDQKSANSAAYQMAHVMAIIFILLLGVVLLLLIHTCRLIVQNNRRLMRFAYMDSLTGADNLLRFTQNLETAREKNPEFSIVALNVHQFKFINEIFGTNSADRLLCTICKEIGKANRDGEFFCRESADTFYLYLKTTEETAVREWVEKLMENIGREAFTGHRDYQIHLYAGVFTAVKDAAPDKMPNELIFTKLRFAMQYARKLPANAIHFYDTEIHKDEEIKNYVESHMNQALEQGEFRLFLQPKFDVKDHELRGAEALVRWIMEDGQMIYPNVFIPQFEKNGFCVKLDMYMVEKALIQIRKWMDEGITPIPISVNQSKLLFFEESYLEQLQELTDRYQIPPELITLEILEGLALEHAEEMNAKLRKLRKMGFQISMDDFGCGYSSFNTLGNLEIDELKLDRSFLLEASREKGNRFQVIMEHIINLTKSLHIQTVAEGVETEEDEDLIRSLGCDLGQGYLYSRPISAEEFDEKYMKKKS